MTQTFTDETYQTLLNTAQPVLLLVHGDDLRGDANTAFKNAADEHTDILFGRIALAENPQAAEYFKAGGKSLLVALHHGETIARRKKPWGSDIPLAIEMLQQAAPVQPDQSKQAQPKGEPATMSDNTPINVTDDNFQAEVIDYDKPVLVDFWAEWCGPCRMVAPILDKLAGEYGDKIRIAKVNVDENPGLSQYFQVMSIPTMMMFKERNIVFNQPGALPEPALRNLLDQLIELEIPAQDEATDEEEPVTE